MKRGVILFHSGIRKIYSERWIKKSVDSMIDQTDNNFIFYEVNYGNEDFSVVPQKPGMEKKFWSVKFSNYAEAMNFILDRAFEDGCDCVFNTNLDDFYHPSRIELQTKMMITGEYDILSSDFCYIEEDEDSQNDRVTHLMDITRFGDIRMNLNSLHNVIAHPAVCYSKKFWSNHNNRYDISKVPEEDMDLWIKSINSGYKFGIHPEILLYYRIHKNQVSSK